MHLDDISISGRTAKVVSDCEENVTDYVLHRRIHCNTKKPIVDIILLNSIIFIAFTHYEHEEGWNGSGTLKEMKQKTSDQLWK